MKRLERDLPSVRRPSRPQGPSRVVSEALGLASAQRDAIDLLHAVPVGIEHQPPAIARDIEGLDRLVSVRDRLGQRDGNGARPRGEDRPYVRRLGEGRVGESRAVRRHADAVGVEAGRDAARRTGGGAGARQADLVHVAATVAIRDIQQRSTWEPRGTDVEPLRARHANRRSTYRGHHPDAAGREVSQVSSGDVLTVARGVGDPTAVGRPGERVRLPCRRDEVRFTAIERLHEHRIARCEHERAAIPRDRPRPESAVCPRPHPRDQHAWHAAQGGDDLDAARRGEEEPLSVGGPRGEPLLALVRNDADGQPSVHLAHEQVGTPRPPRYVGDEPAIRRQRGVDLQAGVERHLRPAA